MTVEYDQVHMYQVSQMRQLLRNAVFVLNSIFSNMVNPIIYL